MGRRLGMYRCALACACVCTVCMYGMYVRYVCSGMYVVVMILHRKRV